MLTLPEQLAALLRWSPADGFTALKISYRGSCAAWWLSLVTAVRVLHARCPWVNITPSRYKGIVLYQLNNDAWWLKHRAMNKWWLGEPEELEVLGWLQDKLAREEISMENGCQDYFPKDQRSAVVQTFPTAKEPFRGEVMQGKKSAVSFLKKLGGLRLYPMVVRVHGKVEQNDLFWDRNNSKKHSCVRSFLFFAGELGR